MCKILVVTYGGGHVNMVIPVIKQLLDMGHQVTVLGLTTAGKALAQAGIAYLGYTDLLKYSHDSRQALGFGRQLVGEASASEVVPYEESVAYHGLSYQELWFQHGDEKAKALYEQQGRQAFFPVNLLSDYIKYSAPDLVCATNSPRSERAALQAASNLGIASVCLVDLFAKQEMAWIAKPDFASKICVVTEYVRQAFHKAGRPLDDMVVTGNPVFDKVVSVRDCQQLRQLDSPTPTILWASQVEPEKHPFTGAKGDPSLPLQIDAALLTIAENNPQWNFVFRFHPSENRVLQYAPCNVSMGDKSEDLTERKRQVMMAIGMVVIGVITIAFYAKDQIVSRVELATKEITFYLDGEQYQNSVGYRLELYKGSVEVIKHYPILGVGLGAEMDAIAEMADKGLVRPMPEMKNVHNQILQEGVAKGLLGIISYFVLMGYLLKIFLTGMFKSSQFREIHTAGVMLIVGYFIIGLTNITFTHGVFNTFFVVMVALLLGVNGLLDDYKRIMSSSSK